MVNNQPQAKGQSEDSQREQRLEDALEHLKVLHLQLRNLRTTLPRMLEPVSYKYPSSKEFLATFGKAVAEANKEVTDARAALNDEKSVKILQQASQSRRMNPKGIRPWRATDDPDWTTVKK